MRCIIVEDQPPAQRILRKYIDDLGSMELMGTFSNAIQAIEFLRTEKVELIFLDIHLPKISGIEFLKTLPDPPKVIFTTAYSDYALEGYDLNVVDYLLKPFSFERFLKAVSKVPASFDQSNISNTEESVATKRQEIFIKSGYEHVKINIEDIIYIHSDADYTEIICAEKKYLSHNTLRIWEENLSSLNFMRSHKSYLVNISKIEKIIGNQIHFSSADKAPIGRAFKEEFMRRILEN